MEYLRPVYTATTIEEAKANFDILEEHYSEKYPMAVNVWKNNWDALTHYFSYSSEIRHMMYTANAIESYNSVHRKYTKNKRSFVSNEAKKYCISLPRKLKNHGINVCLTGQQFSTNLPFALREGLP